MKAPDSQVEPTPASRRLAAILSADVAGYSRLMGADEQATVRTLDRYRAAFRRQIEASNGRVVDMAGDSVLAEFASVVQAVRCAVSVQTELAKLNVAAPADRRMRFRIGVNLGDVIAKDDGTIYGDGVNIAARIEALADPGGVSISGAVFDHVDGKLDLAFEGLGVQRVKNIARPIRLYRVRLAEPGAQSATATTHDGEAPLPLPDKPSIAVLPFANLSADPEQAYFSDGITEDIITDLSQFSGLFVIARNSTFAYKGEAVNVTELCRKLGVRYVLEGSIRKAGNRVRINAQLIDGESGGHLWAERYDRELDDIFAVQDEVTRKIVAALRVELTDRERAQCAGPGTVNLEAYDWYLRARELSRHSGEGTARARRMFARAVELDGDFAEAHAGIAMTHMEDYTNQWIEDFDTALDKAWAAAQKAVALGERCPRTHLALGIVRLWRREHAAAIAEIDRVLSLDPNSADGHMLRGTALAYTGRFAEAIESFQRAMRLNPHYPNILLQFLGQAYFMLGRYDEAIDNFQRRVIRNPCTDSSHVWLAAIYGHLGRAEDARAEWAKALEVNPAYSLAERTRLWPYRNPADPARVVDGLRKAGLP